MNSKKNPSPKATEAREPEKETYEETEDELIDSHEVYTMLSWHAPGRPFKKRSFEYFVNASLIALALEIILFLFSQYLLMVVVFALLFLTFALSIVPPRPFYYKITTEGIRIEDHVYLWDELYDFYFMRHNDEQTIHVRTKAFFPGELTITLGDMDPLEVKEAMLPFLPFREYVKPTFVERAGSWMEKNFPLEKGNR